MIKLGILASTRGTDMQAIIDAIEAGSLDAKIMVVVSNKEDAGALEWARKHGIRATFIDHKGKEREEFDKEMASILDAESVDLILLIGFMRLLSPWFCKKYEKRIMNIHPSLLPLFAGGMDTNVHEEVLKQGMKETGCTLHFVTADVDEGPIILQQKVVVEPGETAESLKDKVQEAEQDVILEGIKMFQEGKLK